MDRKAKYVHLFAGERGFTLLEILIALTITLIITAATFETLVFCGNTYDQQKQMAWARDNVRVAMRGITKKVLMAGYDPSEANHGGVAFQGITCDSSQLRIKMDLNGDGAIGSGEGIIYRYDGVNKRITKTEGSLTTPVAKDIQSFTFQYLDQSGNPTAGSPAVRTVRITITGQTERRDPAYGWNNGYRTVSLTTNVSPRNLGLN
jgi:prepilin-type N-terminal cleavage/methylation domain-containing protein